MSGFRAHRVLLGFRAQRVLLGFQTSAGFVFNGFGLSFVFDLCLRFGNVGLGFRV